MPQRHTRSESDKPRVMTDGQSMLSRRVGSARRGQRGGVEAHHLLARGFTERFDALVLERRCCATGSADLQRCPSPACATLVMARAAGLIAVAALHGLKNPPDAVAAAPRGLGQRQGGHEILGRPRRDTQRRGDHVARDQRLVEHQIGQRRQLGGRASRSSRCRRVDGVEHSMSCCWPIKRRRRANL
jgi:hypothetical protein